MISGNQHVDRRDDKKREERADGHAAHEYQTDGVSGGSTCAGDQCQRKVTGDGGSGGHENRAQAGQGRFVDGLSFGSSVHLPLVGKLNDKYTVFRHQADEGHQSHLGIYIERRRPAACPERDVRVGHFQEREDESAEHRQRHRAGEDDKGIAETVELGRKHKEDEDHGKPECREKLIPFGAELTRLTRVIKHISLGQDLGGFVFQKAQRLVKRTHAHAADRNGIELLKTV